MSDSATKPVIFVAFANDQDDQVSYLRNLPEEARQIREQIQRAKRDELCEIVERSNATASDIFRVFQDPEYRDRIAVFHYGGHANGYQLLLESSDGQPAVADAGGFADFLGQQNGLQLVFLNGCSTQDQVEGMLNVDVPAVIATSRSIDDQVAMNFARQFYQGLAGGASIRTSYNEAAASVKTAKGDNTRSLYLKGENQQKQSSSDVDRLPWDLYLKQGAEIVADWNLPMAVGDPLFGLPELPHNDLPPSPFRHLSWFDAEHADVFFGRGHQIREMYEMLTRPDSTPIVLLYGQSGVGKSSLLAAGLLPRLKDTHEICYVRRDQELGLLGSVKQGLLNEKLDSEDLGEKSIHFAKDWADVEIESSKPLILIVDQLEECFTRPNPNLPHELDEFLNEIDAILGKNEDRPQGRLILGFRKEWLAEIELRLQERRLPRTKVFLERLGRLGIIEAILGPTKTERLQEQYGLSVESGLAEMIADELLNDSGSAIAPTLQILLTKMWTKAIAADQSQPGFDRELYLRLQKEGILLQDFLDQQLAEIRQWRPDVVDSGLVLDLLTMHTTPLGTAAKRDVGELPQSYPHRADVLEPLLQKCKDLYLLVDPSQDRRSTEKGTRLSHDTLAPLVRARFEESDKPGQRARRILDNRVTDWKDAREGAPLDPVDLEIVEQGQAGSRALNGTELRLLTASREERDKRIRAQRLLKFVGGVAIVIIAGMAILLSSNKYLQALDDKVDAINEKQRAEKDLTESRKLVDTFFTTVSEDVLINQKGMTTLRDKLLKKAEGYYDDFASKHGDVPELQADVAVAKFNLGHIKHLRGDDTDAIKLYEVARGIQRGQFQKIPAGREIETTEDRQLALEYSKTLMDIGNATDDLVEQEQAFKDAKDIRKRLFLSVDKQDPMWVEYQLRFADACMNIGLCEENQQNFDKARDHYKEAQLTREKILELLSGPELLNLDKEKDLRVSQAIRTHRDLGMGLQNLKRLYEELGRKSDDESAYIEQIKKTCLNAIDKFKYVLENRENDTEVRFFMGDNYLSLAYLDPDKDVHYGKLARQELEIVVLGNPSIMKYRDPLAQTYTLWGELDESQKALFDEMAKRMADPSELAIDVLQMKYGN